MRRVSLVALCLAAAACDCGGRLQPLDDSDAGAGGGGAAGGAAAGGGFVENGGGGATGGGAAAGGGSASGGGSSSGGGGFSWPFDGGLSSCTTAGTTVELMLNVSDAGFQMYPRLLLDPQGYALTWSDDSANVFVAKVARLDPSGRLLSAPQALLGAMGTRTNEWQPKLAAGDDGYGATLQYNDSFGHQNVFFAPLDPTATVESFAPAGVPFGGAPGTIPSWPTPVWNPVDHEWGLFWHEIGASAPPPLFGLWFGRATPDGTWLGKHPIVPEETMTFSGPVFGQGAGRGVVWNGDGYAVAYVENRSVGVSLTRLSRDGGFVSADTVDSVPRLEVFPDTSLAWNGSSYGVLWLEWPSPQQRVRFAHADSSGTFVGSVTEISTYDAPVLGQDWPRPTAGVVSTGDGWFVIWLEYETNLTTSQLWGVKLALDGSEVPGTRRKLTCDGLATMLPDVVWAGDYAAIAFTRGSGAEHAQHLGLLFHRP